MPNQVVTVQYDLSCRARRSGRGTCFFLLAGLLVLQPIGRAQARPKISGTTYVKLYVSDIERAANFYSIVLRSSIDSPPAGQPCDWCERTPVSLTTRNGFNPIELEPLGSLQTTNLLAEIGLATDDAEKLRKFLVAHHIQTEKLTKCGEPTCFAVLDPEQHRLVFVQSAPSYRPVELAGAYSPGPPPKIRIIHAGFIVRDREKMEYFYKDILGFRPYWHGGMKDDGVDNWVSFQVPDGSDWIEFMLNVPDNADKHLRGVMNHIALGVTDIQAAKAQLIKNGLALSEEPKIGRDGKWQLNVYDPDETRIEFMEFTPKGKTCCSEFTAPHPKP